MSSWTKDWPIDAGWYWFRSLHHGNSAKPYYFDGDRIKTGDIYFALSTIPATWEHYIDKIEEPE